MDRQTKALLPIPQTINGLLARAREQWPERPYLLTRNGETLTALSYGDVVAEAEAVASGLIVWGIQPGERIALLAENRPAWISHYFGILLAGGVVVPVDSLMTPREIASILGMARVRLLITTAKFAQALRDLPAAERVTAEIRLLEQAGDSGYDALPGQNRQSLPVVSPDDIAVIIFTSGTTGVSKGVVLSHGNLCADAESVLEKDIIHCGDNFHLLLPLHHTYSSTVNMICALAVKARATFATSYKSRDILDDIRIARVTILVGVPQVFENIMQGIRRGIKEAPAVRRFLFRIFYGVATGLAQLGLRRVGRPFFGSLRTKAGLDSLTMMISGGAALRPEVNRFFERLGFTLLQGYGLTETSPVVSVNLPGRNRIGSVGPPLPGVSFRIDQPDENGVGEICIRGPMVMQGYFENPAATAEVIRDGWFHSGDAGYLDADGYLYITGRIKNVIITGAGKNVHPEEIEIRLNSSPFVLESLVLGAERKRGAGEELFALIVPDQPVIEAERAAGIAIDVTAEIQRVVDEYNNSVPPYRRLRQWRLHEAELEKTSTRKIRRYVYRNAFKDVLER